jgi:hypothetical protein
LPDRVIPGAAPAKPSTLRFVTSKNKKVSS